MIIHIPHSSTKSPIKFPQEEINRMTDWYTDDLFDYPCRKIIFPYSRLYCDVERFLDDPMETKGMGICYTKMADGNPLRDVSSEEKQYIVDNFYWKHHKELESAVDNEISKYGKSLIIDGHSFPSEPLPYEDDSLRPDICVGTSENTPFALRQITLDYFDLIGYSVSENRPFEGCIVPLKHIGDKRVASIMIEVNRGLYVDGNKKTENYDTVKRDIQQYLSIAEKYIRDTKME